MGKDAGSAPQAPDPRTTIGAQSAADKNAFNYKTDSDRYNTYGPDSSQTWNKNSTFDQTGYDAALKSWQTQNPQGKWVPDTPASAGFTGSGESFDPGSGNLSGGSGGHWEGGVADGNSAPTRDQFTTNKWDLTTALSPEQQKLHDLNQSSQVGQAGLLDALTQRLKGTYDTPFSTASAPGLVGSLKQEDFMNDPKIQEIFGKMAGLDPKAYSQEAGDAVYNQSTRYLDPQVKQNQQALEARLSEQGFVPGTPGYAQAMQTMQDTNNRAYADARDRATTQGYSVGHTQFGDSESQLSDLVSRMFSGKQGDFENQKAAGAFQNTARGQDIAELMQERAQPLNELNSLRAGTQQMVGQGSPGQGGAPQGGGAQISSPDIMGAYNQQYKAAMDKYNADVSSDNATTGTIGSVVGMLAMYF